MFCKTFDNDEVGQILVRKDHSYGELSSPAVVISWAVEAYGIVSIVLYTHNEDAMDRLFEDMMEKQEELILNPVLSTNNSLDEAVDPGPNGIIN